MRNILSKYAPFEKRLLEAISLFVGVLMTTLLLIDFDINAALTNMIHLILISYGFLAYSLSRFRQTDHKYLITPLIIILYTAITYYWFRVSGINGATGVGALVVVFISFLFTSPGKRKWVFWLNISYVCCLIIGHYFFEELIMYGTLIYNESLYEYSGVALGMIILIYLVKVQVDNERRTIRLKNEQLELLNKSLKSTVKSQFKTLKELTNTQIRLVESEKMASMGTLTAGLAHEVNNPLNFVGGVVNPIRRDIDELKDYVSEENRAKAQLLTDEIAVLLDSIENGTEKASQVVKKLLSLTPGRNNSNEFHRFNVSELINDIVRLVRKSTPHIEFYTEIEPETHLIGNEIEINQVILNLLRNSIQAIPEGKHGIIKIICFKTDEGIDLSIEDNGIGMDEETAKNAFNAFYTTKENGLGTGLGLFISHGIIQKHGGEIRIDSSTDNGTIISIKLLENSLENTA